MKKDKKVYHVCDWNYKPGYYKFDKHRFPEAYLELAPWYLVNFKDAAEVIKGKNNTIWFATPVHDELNKLNIIKKFIDDNDVYIIGEGSIWCWMYDWPAPEQELYIELLSKCKGYTVANKFDQDQIKLFTPNPIIVTPCTNKFIEDARTELGEYIFLVNPSKGYQRGMMSHKLVYDSAPKNIDVYSLKFNRKPHSGRNISLPDSYSMPGFKQLDRMDWERFMAVVYNSRFGVDIHRDFSAGQTTIDFGSLGVPLVGNIKLDAQRLIFPDISFEWNDYENIKKCIYKLSVDNDFCLEIGRKALENTKKYYNSLDVVNKFNTLYSP